MQIEIFLAALTLYESCCKAAAIEGSLHATDTYAYVHIPPTVVGKLVSARADGRGQPGRCMMHSRLTFAWQLPYSRLASHTPLLPTHSKQSPPSPPPTCHVSQATRWPMVMSPSSDGASALCGPGAVWPQPRANAFPGPRSAQWLKEQCR